MFAAVAATQRSPVVKLDVVGTGGEAIVSVDATNVAVGEIVTSLSAKVGFPVRASSLAASRKATLALKRVPVLKLLETLAPVVHVDYEVRWDGQPDDWVAAHITGYNEPEPAVPVPARPFLVLAGSTDNEAGAAGHASSALDVTVVDGQVSIRARRHMFAAPVLELASRAGLGYLTRGDLDESLIDIEVQSIPWERLPRALGRPGFGLLMRRNASTGARRPVAVIIGDQATRFRPPTPSPTPSPTPPSTPTPTAAQRVR